MQVYNNSQDGSTKSGNSTPSCSYCRDPQHRATDCPHVAGDWAMFQNFQIPCSDPNNWTNNPTADNTGQRSWNTQANTARWFAQPDGWSKWYAHCKNAFHKQQQARARQTRAGTTRRASKCGFCGSLHHNRRNCTEMTAYTDRIIKANQVWRQRFYDRFVTDLGLSVGAVTKVKVSGGWNQPETEKIGVITSVNWDELSLFCFTDEDGRGWSTRLNEKFRQYLKVTINVDGDIKTLSFKKSSPRSHRGWATILFDEHGGLVDQFSGWHTASYIETIARSETPLDQDWVNQGHEECAKFVTKKYSKEKLDDWNVTSVLNKTEEIQQNA